METFLSGNTSIRMHVHEPAGAGPYPAILLLHGSGGNVSFWLDRMAPQLSRLGIALYAAHYFDRTGTTRADAATILDGYHFPLWQQTIADALVWIAARQKVDSRRIVLLGISLGAFLSLTLAAEHPQNIRAVMEISGGLPEPYAGRATAAFPPTLILHGGADTIVSVDMARNLDQLLTGLKVPHATHLYPGEGHWFSPGAQLQILGAMAQFLRKHL